MEKRRGKQTKSDSKLFSFNLKKKAVGFFVVFLFVCF